MKRKSKYVFHFRLQKKTHSWKDKCSQSHNFRQISFVNQQVHVILDSGICLLKWYTV